MKFYKLILTLAITIFFSNLLFLKVYAIDLDYQENFALDRIIVTLSNEQSSKLINYDTSYFKELNLKEIVDLTQTSKEVFKNRKGDDEYCDNLNIKKFNQTLCLHLKTNTLNKLTEAMQLLQKRDEIIAVSPDYYTTINSTIPDDTYLSNQWALENANLYDAWDITRGSNYIKVGIIDSGIQGNHPDLSMNIDSSLSVDCTSGSPVNIGIPTDSGSHGTHVAGIIGARGYNNMGIAGCLWYSKLVSLQHFIGNSGTISSFIACVDYANANNISILNYSGDWETDYIVNDLSPTKIILSNYPGLLITAAGNKNYDIDIKNVYPAVYDLDNIIAVGNLTINNTKSTTSNYGAYNVDLFAPGTNIYSTIPNSTYDYKTGTSMAAPYVTGVAALIKSIRPDLSAEEIKKIILNNVDTVSNLSGLCVTGGKLNAYKTVRAATERQTFLGDVNGDGYKDIIMSGKNSNNNRVLTTLLGNSNGSFTNELSFTSTKYFYYCDLAYPGDFNGDGMTDIIVMWNNGGYRKIYIYLGNSNGSFNEAVNLTSIRIHNSYLFPYQALVSDINNDSCDDFIISFKNTSGKRCFLVYKGTGTSPYMLDATTNALTSIYDYFDDSKIYSGDFNNDGYSDILVPTYDSNEKRNITIYTGKSDGTFNEGQLLVSTKNHKPYLYPYKYLVGDYNGDGYSDFLTTYKESGYRKTLLYSGKTSNPYINEASYMNSVPLYNYSLSDYVFSGDVNGDSYDDLIVHYKNSYGKRCLRVYNGNLTNMFENVHNTTTTNNHNENQYPCGVYSSDVNDDGYCDIIVKWKDGDNSRFYVYKGKNDSTFTSAISTTTNTSFYS